MNIDNKDIQLHTFEGGMDSDTAPELMAPNRARYMMNVRSYSFGQRGVITNVKGNTLIETPLPDGENSAHGYGSDEENNQFYFIIFNSNGYHTFYMYDAIKNNVTVLLQSRTDSNGVDILTLNKDYLINHVDIIPSINGPLVTWCDGWNKAGKFNRNKALDKSSSGYGLIIFKDFITAYKKCSIYAPVVTYFTDITRDSNFLYGKLFKFSVRFIYDDGEKSNWSDYSLVALPPNQSYSGLNSITNSNNCIRVQIETGNQLVIKLEIAMKVGSLDFVTTSVLDKATLGITDNSTFTFNFYNDGADVSTDQEKIIRQYSFLPDKPFCQAYVENAMTYTNFREGFESINVLMGVTIAYKDLFIPDGTVNQINHPSFISTLLTNGYSSGSAGFNSRYNVKERFQIGFDVKAGNYFQLYGGNGRSANFVFKYKANAADTAITVANRFKSWLRAIGRGRPDGPNGISNENIDGSGNVSWDYEILGFWNESPVSWYSQVEPVNFQTLKDDGTSVNLIKPGSVRKYAIAYEDEDGRKSNAYTSDTCVINTGFITQVGDKKQAVHTVSIHNKPPVWARYYYLLRTPDSGPWLHILIQKIIKVDPDPNSVSAGNNQKYLDLVVGSLFTYQKLHPNTVLAYEFTKGDRIRLIAYYDTDNNNAKVLYPYLETEILSYSINTEEVVNDNVQVNGTDAVQVAKSNSSYIGKTIIIQGYERTIIGVPNGTTYRVDSPISDGSDGAQTYPTYKIVDQRGILRIKQPVGIDVKDLSLVELYKPQLNNSVDGYKNFYPFGVKLEIGNYGTNLRYHAGTVQNQYQTGPNDAAIIDVVQGDAFQRNRELPTNNSVPGTQLLVDGINDPNYSDFYESNLTSLGRVFPQDDGSGVKDFGSRTRFSNAFIQDTRVNGLNDFDNADREDYNDPYGDTMLTKFSERKLLFFKRLKTSWVPVRQSIITDNANQALLGTSSKLLGQMNYYAWQGGIGNNPESYVSNGNYKYFASSNSGAFMRLAGDGCDPISTIYDFDKEARRILSIADRLGLRIYGGFDKENHEVVFSIPAYDNYIFKGSFIESEWNIYNDVLPDGTTFEIVQQPENSTVESVVGGMFQITTGSVLGDDFYIYRAKLPNGTYLPNRRECFSVVQPPNRPINYRIIDDSKYCIVRNVGYRIQTDSKYCLKREYGYRIQDGSEYCVQQFISYYSAVIDGNIRKNDCAGGETGTFVYVYIAAGTYTSAISQEDADDQAEADAQAQANTAGTCLSDTFYSTLLMDYLTDPSADLCVFVVTPGLDETGIIATGTAENPSGPLLLPNDGTDPANCYLLSSDKLSSGSVKWRFGANLAYFAQKYNGIIPSIKIRIQGRNTSAGVYNLRYAPRPVTEGYLQLGGSTGSRIPSVSSGTSTPVDVSSHVTGGATGGLVGTGVGSPILDIEYTFATNAIVHTTY